MTGSDLHKKLLDVWGNHGDFIHEVGALASAVECYDEATDEQLERLESIAVESLQFHLEVVLVLREVQSGRLGKRDDR